MKFDQFLRLVNFWFSFFKKRYFIGLFQAPRKRTVFAGKDVYNFKCIG